MLAMAPGRRPPPAAGDGLLLGTSAAELLPPGDPAVVGLAVPPSPARVWKATTWLADVASSSPAATLGVGKWLAGWSITACCRACPVPGSRPYSVPFWPMVQTRPAATMGGPPATGELHSTRSPGGDEVTRTAVPPPKHGRYTMVPLTAAPPSISEPHTPRSAACSPPMPPRCAPSSR